MPGALHVGGIAQQRKHALLAELAEAGEVYHLALHGGDVYLEVAGVDDHAHGRAYGERHGVGYRVVHVYELYLEAAEAELVSRALGEYLRVVQQVVLLKLQLDYACRERRGVDRHVQLAHHIRQRADVILVSVSDYYASDAVFILLQVRNIGYNDINAVELLVRKSEAAVHDDNVLPVLVHGEILSYLTKTAERNDF